MSIQFVEVVDCHLYRCSYFRRKSTTIERPFDEYTTWMGLLLLLFFMMTIILVLVFRRKSTTIERPFDEYTTCRVYITFLG